jgi:hypothetical protein
LENKRVEQVLRRSRWWWGKEPKHCTHMKVNLKMIKGEKESACNAPFTN